MTRKELENMSVSVSMKYNRFMNNVRDIVTISIHENEILQEGDYKYTYFYEYNGKEIYNDSYHNNNIEKNISETIKEMHYNIEEIKDLEKVINLLINKKYTLN